jgi:D-alanine-D-alanine ligase
MEKQDVILLYGGRSGEHEVSLRSAAFVYTHLDRSRFSPWPVGIDKSGIWYLQDRELPFPIDQMPLKKDPSRIVSLIPGRGLAGPTEIPQKALVFPVLHGSFGEDGTLQGALEITGLPYVGADTLGCSLSMDKEMIKKVWIHHGLPVVPFVSLTRARRTAKDFSLNQFREELSPFGYPLFVKPANTGSSLGVSRVDSPEELEPAMEEAFIFDRKILIEPCVTAREIECSVVGNDPVTSFPLGEVVSSHRFYDYKAKYEDPQGAKIIIPAPMEKSLSDRIRLIAEKAFLSAGLSGFARVDFFLDETKGEFYLNELNAIPGFTSISMFPMMCREGGLAPRELTSTLIDLALERHEEKENLRYSVI